MTATRISFVLASALAASVSFGSVAQADNHLAGGDTTVVFAGIDLMEDSTFGYLGAIYAMNGLGVDGWAVKGVVGGGAFEFTGSGNNSSNAGPFDGDSITFDALIGYRVFHSDWQFGLYMGLNYWDIDNSDYVTNVNVFAPSTTPAPVINDGEAGFKVELEATRSGQADRIYADLRGNYSTAFDTYWARGRIGHEFETFTLGVEGAANGNDDYDQLRIGAFGSMKITGSSFSIDASIGYADTDSKTRGQPGTSDNPGTANVGGSVYGTIGASTVF